MLPVWLRRSVATLTLEQAAALLEAAEDSRLRRQAEERARAGELGQEHGLVFTTTVGTPFGSHNLRRDFRKVTAAAGLGSRWVPKELRTSFVSMMATRVCRSRRSRGWPGMPARGPPRSASGTSAGDHQRG
jgi:site-specific recombinase XerC